MSLQSWIKSYIMNGVKTSQQRLSPSTMATPRGCFRNPDVSSLLYIGLNFARQLGIDIYLAKDPWLYLYPPYLIRCPQGARLLLKASSVCLIKPRDIFPDGRRYFAATIGVIGITGIESKAGGS